MALKALVVDDKEYGRHAAKEVCIRLGYSEDDIIIARYGDEALQFYQDFKIAGASFGVVLTDYHMDVFNKGNCQAFGWIRKPQILDGVTLTRKILEVDPTQKIIVISGGLTNNILDEINGSGALAGLYKRKPADAKFEGYVESIRNLIIYGKSLHVQGGILNRRVEDGLALK